MRGILRVACVVAMSIALVMVGAGLAAAGPTHPPDYGVMEPGSDGCPWPDPLNGLLESVGAQKCLPDSVGWSADGVRIVSDPLVGAGGAHGWVTFRCQSKVGLQFIITAVGLAPHSVYPVTATGLGAVTDLATLRTDQNGNGMVGGMVRLEPGDYEGVLVSVGSVLTSPGSDAVGFEVF